MGDLLDPKLEEENNLKLHIHFRFNSNMVKTKKNLIFNFHLTFRQIFTPVPVPDPHLDPYGSRRGSSIRIRIRITTKTDPRHCLYSTILHNIG